ncbi:AbrB family transcriptional regulator [Sinorhizobium meliloti]|uniref:AbrB family transcriptional regulator n=1 Tax=Rhizobium meliloti TaxID=382 RepID=UPI00041CD586|nr:AbrB family transcriptional regulator [Sinorhizobium meliloti]
MRPFLAQFAPSRFPYGKLLPALVIGFIGGCIFLYFHLPLPWMLGSLVTCLVASLFNMRIAVPGIIRPPMLMLVGVVLGSGFTPEMAGSMMDWLPGLGILVLFVIMTAACCYLFFRRAGGLDHWTAFFSGMPGGLVEMTALGEVYGANTRTIALVHSSRIMLVVLSLPFVLSFVGGQALTGTTRSGASVLDAPISEELWLFGTSLCGAFVGRLLSLPSPFLMGPMLMSAAVHLTGISAFHAPWEIIAFAQLVLGSALGCSFAGVKKSDILHILRVSVGSTIFLLAASTSCALLVAHLTGRPILSLLLAFSPGGLTETSLMALSLHVDVAFVATHHVLRVFFVAVSATLLARALKGSKLAKEDASPAE